MIIFGHTQQIFLYTRNPIVAPVIGLAATECAREQNYIACIQNTRSSCIQDTLSSRAALGLPLGRVRRASKGILHTTYRRARALGLAAECACEQRYLAYNYLAYTNIIDFGP